MKRRFAVIMAALLIAAMAGCSQSGTSSTAEQSTTQSSADSSVAESAESEISEAESSAVSEEASIESSDEKSDTSVAESSDNKSKTESSQSKTDDTSKKTDDTSKKPDNGNSGGSGNNGGSSKQTEVKATGVTLDLSSLSLTSGSTQELNAYILWSNGTSSYNGITWSTSNNGVATVSSSGYVTAKSAGTATITASYGRFSKSCTVTVKAASQPSSQPSGGGNGGSTSKPSGGSQTKPPESSTPPEISYGNEPSSTPSTGFGYYGTYPQKVSGSWGWIRYRSDNLYWLIEDGQYKDEKGKTYSAKFNPSEHEAVKSRNGKYTFYLCPEAITVLNEMAAEEGKHFTWETEDNFWYCAGDRRGCADNLEYLRETDSAASPHETNYSDSSPALILGSMHDFDWYWFFDDMRNNAKSHWKLLMDGNRLKPQRTVMVYYVAESGGFGVAIK